MARALGGHGPERGEPDARGQALEQRSLQPGLEPGDEARQRRLGDGEPLGGGENPARFRDREELDQVAAPVEHSAVFRFRFIERISSRSASGPSAPPGPIPFFNRPTGFSPCPAIPCRWTLPMDPANAGSAVGNRPLYRGPGGRRAAADSPAEPDTPYALRALTLPQTAFSFPVSCR